MQNHSSSNIRICVVEVKHPGVSNIDVSFVYDMQPFASYEKYLSSSTASAVLSSYTYDNSIEIPLFLSTNIVFWPS